MTQDMNLFGGDPAEVERSLDEWVAGFEHKAARYQELQHEVDDVRISATRHRDHVAAGAGRAPAARVAGRSGGHAGAAPGGVAVADGTWLRVGRTEPRPWNVVESDLGFTPTVWVVFRLDKEN